MKHELLYPDTSIRVVIADDHLVVRDGLTALVTREPDMAVVGHARTGREAIAVVLDQQPHVALLDLRMPDGDGVEAIAALRSQAPATRLLVLTTYDGDEDIYRGLRAGAHGYLLKDVPYEELLAAIRAVHAGQQYLPAGVANKLAVRVHGNELTERERSVLQLLVEGRSNAEIGVALNVSEGTAKFHVANILTKLQVQDRTQAVVVALKRGLARLPG